MATDRGARPGCKKATGGSCRGVRWRTGGIARGPAGPYGERPDGTLCHHARSVAMPESPPPPLSLPLEPEEAPDVDVVGLVEVLPPPPPSAMSMWPSYSM